MGRKIEMVNKIVEIKREIAGGRDYLKRIKDHSEHLISKLELKLQTVREKWRQKSLQNEIEKHRAIAKCILDSAQDANALAVSPSGTETASTIVLFISKIRALQKKILSICNITSTFKNIYKEFAAMVTHATELKKLVAA